MMRWCNFAVPVTALAAIVLLAGGCATERTGIPADARLVAESNERLVYEVPRDGVIYIYDDNSNRLIYTGEVNRGQTLLLDAREDDIMIDQRRATEWDLDPDHNLQVYLEEQPRGERRVIVEERREMRRD